MNIRPHTLVLKNNDDPFLQFLASRGLKLRPDLPEYVANNRRKRMEERFQRLRFDLLEEDAARIIDELEPLFYTGAGESGVCFITDIGKADPAFKFIMPLFCRTCLMRENGDSITVIIPESLLEALEKHSEPAARKADQEKWDAMKKEFLAAMNQATDELLARHRAKHESEEPTH